MVTAKSVVSVIQNTLIECLSRERDEQLLQATAATFGSLIKLPLTTVVDTVEMMFSRTFEWISSASSFRVQAACLLLAQLAANAPSSFYAHIDTFLQVRFLFPSSCFYKNNSTFIFALHAILRV
jgi:hypothetical protein